MISKTFVILMSISYYLQFLSLIAQASSPAQQPEQAIVHCTYICGQAGQGMLFLPHSGYHISWAEPIPAVRHRRLWESSRLQLWVEISVGSGTELPGGYPTVQPGESQPLVLAESWALEAANPSSCWTAEMCSKSFIHSSTPPFLPPSKTLLWLMLKVLFPLYTWGD